MERPSGKTLVGVLAAVGASVGAAAAVVWHVGVGGSGDAASGIDIRYIRPSWFPVTLYLVLAGLAIGLAAASFLVDSGLRLVQDRQRSRIHLFALLIGIGAALGAGSGLAWTHWPPQPTEVVVLPPTAWPRYFESHGNTPGLHQSLVATIHLEDEADPSTFSPIIGNPWLVFPIGGVAIAALAALTLSLRDFRLVVSRSDQQAR